MTALNIAVHGATGSQGEPVARRLRAAGHHVRAVTRASGADLSDPTSLIAAYEGIDVVVLQLPLVFDAAALRQAESVLVALHRVRLPRLVFNANGGLPDTPIGVPFVDARARLRAELPNVVATVACVSPAATYAENLSAPWSAPLIAGGEVCYPLPAEAPVPWVAIDDVAAVIAALVTDHDPTPAQLVAGPEDLTGPAVAERLAVALGHPVTWKTITAAEYATILHPHFGPETAAGIAASYDAPAAPPDPTLIRRGPTTLAAWARRQVWQDSGAANPSSGISSKGT